MNNYFIFDGWNSKTALGLTIEKRPAPQTPMRKQNVYSVAGREDVVEDLGSYSNIILQYQVGCADIDRYMPAIKEMIASAGYCKLTDSYHTGGFRRAFINNAIQFTEDLLNFGHAVIEFSADPYFYLDEGETAVNVASGTTGTYFINPETFYTAKPLITATGTAGSDVTLRFGTDVFTFKIPTGKTSVTIDSLNETVYSGTTNEVKFYLSDTFPIFKGVARTKVTFTGATSISIKPRWRRL